MSTSQAGKRLRTDGMKRTVESFDSSKARILLETNKSQTRSDENLNDKLNQSSVSQEREHEP